MGLVFENKIVVSLLLVAWSKLGMLISTTLGCCRVDKVGGGGVLGGLVTKEVVGAAVLDV